MKKLIPLLLAIALILIFACCGEKETETTTTTTETTTETTTTQPLTIKVVFPEGYTLVQIAEKIEQEGICDASEIIALANDVTYIQSLGYSFISEISNIEDRAFPLEGYLFPDTYEFYRKETAEKVLKRFLDNTERKLTEQYRLRAQELGYTLDELIILASIVQKESFTNDSVKNVASVLHNRLSSPSFPKLQCDVTIHYVNDYITNSPYLSGDTSVYAPIYNTYKCLALPVGAICCPGLASIEAALYPAETDYYYFVTDTDKNYYFSETYEQHKVKCRELGLM